VLEALRRGVADVGIVADYVDTAGLRVQPWLDDELVAVLPRGAGSPRTRTVRFAELLDRPFVGLLAERGLSRFLVQQASRSGRVPHHRVRVDNFDAVARLVASRVGVAVMPRAAADRWRDAALRIVSLTDGWAKRRLLVCTTEPSDAAPGVRSLVEDLLLAPAPTYSRSR
jgi:DNA-binding transcriptional LysR family regulator